MATFIDVFQRKEVKYRLSARQHRAMLDVLAGRLALDEYGRTRVSSMYFDTPDWQLIERSLDKPLYKEKLRLRWYGAVRPDARAFVEIKKKYKGIVYKRRVGCSYAAARAYLDGLMPYERACARFPLLDPQEAGESVAPRSRQIVREVDQFLARYESLRPSMLISCEREAYAPVLSPAGDDDAADLRITFDANIAYRDLMAEERARANAADLMPLLSDGQAIMEIKAAGPFPLWLVRALGACQAYPTSFSKCGEAYRACMSGGASGARIAAASTAPAASDAPAPLGRHAAPQSARVPTWRAPAQGAEAFGRHAAPRRPARALCADRSVQADAGERLAAFPGASPRHCPVPNRIVKKGGRCA